MSSTQLAICCNMPTISPIVSLPAPAGFGCRDEARTPVTASLHKRINVMNSLYVCQIRRDQRTGESGCQMATYPTTKTKFIALCNLKSAPTLVPPIQKPTGYFSHPTPDWEIHWTPFDLKADRIKWATNPTIQGLRSNHKCLIIRRSNALAKFTTHALTFNEAREARSAILFSGFPRKKASSYRIAYDGRVPLTTFSVCVHVCVKFFGHVCPPHSAYPAPRPVPTGPVYAHKQTTLLVLVSL